MRRTTLENYIKEKGLKQKKVAESMGMKAETWYKNRLCYCKNVSIEEIHNLADYLNVTPLEAFELVYNNYIKDMPK